MVLIIDRRKNGNKASLINRQRFLNRYKSEIRDKLNSTISSNEDIKKQSYQVNIKLSTHEPTFHFDYDTGVSNYVLPGNTKYMTGDKIPKPSSTTGGGSSAGKGEGKDEYSFVLNEEEYLNIIFDGLELPNITKVSTNGSDLVETARTGFQNNGANLDLISTFKKSIMRRTALLLPLQKRLKALESEYKVNPNDELLVEINNLKKRILAITFIDDQDVKYRRYSTFPKPMSKVVMFFVLDVSGSVTEKAKDMAKRFCYLTYLFLQRMYSRSEVVFITFTDTALEVDEEEFFHSMRSGGTLFSSGLSEAKKIIAERYPSNEWNIFTVFLTDSDNYDNDAVMSLNLFKDLLSVNQLLIYSHLKTTYDDIEKAYAVRDSLKSHDNFEFITLKNSDDIYPEFKKVFRKKHAK